MLNEDDLFLVSIFRRAYPFDLKPSAEEFLRHSSFEIYRTCRVMKLLGLVEDAPSTLGFKPSDLLIDIVAGKSIGRTEKKRVKVRGFAADLWHGLACAMVDALLTTIDSKDELAKPISEQAVGRREDDGEGDQEDEGHHDDCEHFDDFREFISEVFIVLGLLKRSSKMQYVPTRLMRGLLLKTCVSQLSKALALNGEPIIQLNPPSA
jgi:hypothetical protein